MVEFIITILVGVTVAFLILGGITATTMALISISSFIAKNHSYLYLYGALILMVIMIAMIFWFVGAIVLDRYKDYKYEKGRKKYKNKKQFCYDILKYRNYYKEYDVSEYDKDKKVIKELQYCGLVENKNGELLHVLHKIIFENSILTKEVYIFYSDDSVENLSTRLIDVDINKYSSPEKFWEEEINENRKRVYNKYEYKRLSMIL